MGRCAHPNEQDEDGNGRRVPLAGNKAVTFTNLNPGSLFFLKVNPRKRLLFRSEFCVTESDIRFGKEMPRRWFSSAKWSQKPVKKASK